jgi:glutamate--cysteine ligase
MTGIAPTHRPFAGVPDVQAPVESVTELQAYFIAGAKAAAQRRLGVELEWLPLLADGTAAPYAGAGRSVSALLLRLAGWRGLQPTMISGNVLGLSAPDLAVHLEPGAQVELALGPRPAAGEILDDLRDWRRLTREIASECGVHLAALGMQPLTPVRAIGWVPKPRYGPMSRYLAGTGSLGHHMMKATASLQVSVDYLSEEDAASLVRTALAASPVVNALCAASPLEDGRPNGFLTKRPAIWADTDPLRTGILPWVFEDGFTFTRYAEWTLAATVMFVERDGALVPIADRTMSQLLADTDPRVGRPTHADYQLHLTTLFPEVRLKQHAEIRGADACGPEMAAAVAALWRGLLYDESGRARVASGLGHLTVAERLRLHADVGVHGLEARARGVPVRELAQDLLAAAGASLSDTEAALLDPLREVAQGGVTRAEALLDAWKASPAPQALLAHA